MLMYFNKYRHFIYLLFASVFCTAQAQQPSYKTKIDFERLNIDNGLSQNIVEVIFQDNYGFVWFGSQDGLNRFDGHNYKYFHHSPHDTLSISNNYVKAIAQTDPSYLWIGTYGGGLNKFDLSSETFTAYTKNSYNKTKLPDNVIYTILPDGDSVLWLGTKAGLVKFNHITERVESFSHTKNNSSSISDNTVYSLLIDRKGVLWVGTKHGLNKVADRHKPTFEQYYTSDSPTSLNCDDIRVLYEGMDGKIWIGTHSGGINYLSPDDNKFYNHLNMPILKLSNNYVRAILQDRKDRLWVGTFGGGLYKLDLKNKRSIVYKNSKSNAKSISDDKIVALGTDQSASIWAGTHGGGVNRFSPDAQRFQLYSHQPDDPHSLICNTINVMAETQDRVMLIGTDQGLNRAIKTFHNDHYDLSFDQDNWMKRFDGKRIWSMYIDKEGDIWVAVWEEGVYVFERDSKQLKFNLRHTPHSNRSLTTNYVEAMHEDHEGNVWLGMIGDGGLCIYNKKTKQVSHWKHDPDNENSLSNDRIHDICQDDQGRMWIATDFGLNLWKGEGNNFDHFKSKLNQANSINFNIIRDIFQARDSALWIGTGGGGINKLIERDGEITFEKYIVSDGLANNNIGKIQEDDNGCLWISTFQGLSKFNVEKQKFHNYGLSDGLQGLEFMINSAFRDSDGLIYFGGSNGLNVFNPNDIRESEFIPPVIFTGIEVIGKKGNRIINSNFISHITLSPQDYLVNFEYAGLDFNDIQKVQFMYKLEGLDNEWIAVANRRFLVFTNLPAGDYTLRIRSANKDGVWDTKGVSLAIEVQPAIWETLWFKLLTGFIFILIIAIYIRLRLHTLRKTKHRLEAMVFDRTKELEMANAKILKQNFLVNEKNEEIKNNLEEIESQRDDISSKNKELLEAQEIINQQNISLKQLNIQLEDLVEERTRALKDSNIELRAVNRELDTFFYKASHDLKGPVATILGLCHIADKDASDEKMKVYISKINNTANHMNKVLFNLHKLNKIKLHKILPVPIKISDFFHDSLKEIIPAEEERSFIDFMVNNHSQTQIITDLTLLAIVCENLISNAVRYTKSNHHPQIHIEIIDDTSDNNYLNIFFKDKGIGVEEAYKDKIFDMFFVGQEHNHGLGLGLYSAKMALKKLNGSISLLEEPDDDYTTVIKIVLPKRLYG